MKQILLAMAVFVSTGTIPHGIFQPPEPPLRITFSHAKKTKDGPNECFELPKGYWLMACSSEGCYGSSKICFGNDEK